MSSSDGTVDHAKSMATSAVPGMRMPLAHAQKGCTYKVVKISGKDETKKHLSDLGFVLDTEVTVISELRGNLVCEVKGVRIALNDGMAERITVIS